jgi:hypothetical protein
MQLLEKLQARRPDPAACYAYALDAGGARLAISAGDFDAGDPRLAVDESTASAGFVISSSRRDRAGDIVLPAGCLKTLPDYEANPVVFFAHRSEEAPIAFARAPGGGLSLWVEQEQVLSRAYFHLQTEESDRIFDLVAKGILRAASIGFVPVAFELLPALQEEVGPGDLIRAEDLGGLLFREWSLMEWSVVPVPANAGALRNWLDRSPLKSAVLRKSLEAAADAPRGQLFLDAQVKAEVAEPANSQPEPTPVDVAGRPQDGGEVPQAVLFSARRFPSADDVKAWMEVNALEGSVSAPEAEGGEYALVRFAPDLCQPDSVRRQEVEDGVTMVFCKPLPGEPAETTSAQADPVKSSTRLTVQAAAPPDVVRWNKSLSPAFDVAKEPLPPSRLEYDWVGRWVGCEVKHLFQNGTMVPSARMGSFLTGLKHALSECELVDVRNIHGGSEAPPVHDVIQLNSRQREDFLVEGHCFYKGPAGPFMLRLEPDYYGLDLRLYTHRDARGFNQGLLDAAWEWARENNFLKGEAFSLGGEFLERTQEGWDDVFLEEVNKSSLRRTVEQLNKKSKDFPSRGVILTGKPGTGKTLSGRIIRNTAEATFIWIAARDFHRSGAFGGFRFGFELARELAPTVLFIEDVDNWLDGHSVDLLKAEMDGITRSRGVWTVLTTNFPEQLPEALIDRPGRFHDVLCFAAPTERARRAMLTAWLPGAPAAAVEGAVKRTDGYSGAHLRELANFAIALQEGDDIPLPAAIERALDRVEEQKELITNVQLHGSRYRPHKSLQARLMRTKSMTAQTPEDAAPPAVKSEPDDPIVQPKAGPRPYGAEVLSAMHGHCCAVKDYLCSAMPMLEHPKVSKWAQKAHEAVGKLHEECKLLAKEEYPDHFRDEGKGGGPGMQHETPSTPFMGRSADPETRLAEALLKQGKAIEQLASALAPKPAEQPVPGPPAANPPPAPGPELKAADQAPAPAPADDLLARFNALASLFYRLTGEEV